MRNPPSKRENHGWEIGTRDEKKNPRDFKQVAKPKSQLNVSERQTIIHAVSVKKSKGVGTGMEQVSDSGYKPATPFTCYPEHMLKIMPCHKIP